MQRYGHYIMSLLIVVEAFALQNALFGMVSY